MKKLFILLSLFATSLAFGAGFGQLDGYYDYQSFSLMSKMLKSNTISYCTYSGPEGTDEQALSQLFRAAFNRWTLGTADYIENAGRAEEFPFAMKVLTKNIKFDYIGQCSPSRNKADIAIVSDIEGCRPADAKYYSGFYSIGEQRDLNYKSLNTKSRICLTKPLPQKTYSKVENYIQDLADGYSVAEPKNLARFEIFRVITHEVGHSLGLSDEYADYMAPLNLKKGSGSPYRGDGIMSTNYLLTDDDINGLIISLYSSADKTISFKPFGNVPGKIMDNKFVMPVDKGQLSEKDAKKLKERIRVSKKDYKKIMGKYLKNTSNF